MQQPPHHHLAQLNIGRIRYEIDDPRMADFTNNLELVNGVAERSAGFIWRYTDDSGSATNTRPYADPRIIINFSVWQNVEALERFVWQTVHERFYRSPCSIGSSILKVPLSCCGGCRPVIGRASRRPSRASHI